MSLKFKFFASNGLRILNKHKFLTLCMVSLMTLTLVLICTTFSQNSKIEDGVKKYQQTFGNKTYYFFFEALNDIDYTTFVDDSNKDDYQKLLKLNEKLYKEKNFSFVSLNEQPLGVSKNNIPTKCLYGYENGDYEDSVETNKGVKECTVKSIQVSDSFFRNFNIKISQGRGFNKNDYMYNKKEIPTLLGEGYKGVYSIGDTFETGYYGSAVCKVVGFIADKSFFYVRSDEEFVSCNRYIVLPAVYNYTSHPTYDDKIILLQHSNGIFVSDKGNTVVDETFNKLAKECKLSKWDFYTTGSYLDSDDNSMNSQIQKYSVMTNDVASHFKIILLVLLCISVISLIISLCGFVREEHYNYGINILCGSSYFDISVNISILTGMIVLASLVVANMILLCTSYSYALGYLLINILAILIWLFITMITVLYLKRITLQDIIGGKE